MASLACGAAPRLRHGGLAQRRCAVVAAGGALSRHHMQGGDTARAPCSRISGICAIAGTRWPCCRRDPRPAPAPALGPRPCPRGQVGGRAGGSTGGGSSGVVARSLRGRAMAPAPEQAAAAPGLQPRPCCSSPCCPAVRTGSSLLTGAAPLPALGLRPAAARRPLQRPAAAGQPAAVAAAAAAVPEQRQQGLLGALVTSVRDQFNKLDGLWDRRAVLLHCMLGRRARRLAVPPAPCICCRRPHACPPARHPCCWLAGRRRCRPQVHPHVRPLLPHGLCQHHH